MPDVTLGSYFPQPPPKKKRGKLITAIVAAVLVVTGLGLGLGLGLGGSDSSGDSSTSGTAEQRAFDGFQFMLISQCQADGNTVAPDTDAVDQVAPANGVVTYVLTYNVAGRLNSPDGAPKIAHIAVDQSLTPAQIASYIFNGGGGFAGGPKVHVVGCDGS